MNAHQIAELLEEYVRREHGDKLVSDAQILVGVPEMCDEIATLLRETLSDWEIDVDVSTTKLLLQKNIANPFTKTSALHGIEIFTDDSIRIWRRHILQNLFGQDIHQDWMLGTSSKDVSRMLHEFRPPVPNAEYELKEGMQGILALTISLEKPVGRDHFEQLEAIKKWCPPNNFCVTVLMQPNFWSEVTHDAEKFAGDVIGVIDREQDNCTGVVISNIEIFEEILPEFSSHLIGLLRERGKQLYSTNLGEVKMPPHKEFGMIVEAEKRQEAEQAQTEIEPDLNSILEQTRVGFDQLEFTDAGDHNYPILLAGKSVNVLDVKRQNGHYIVVGHFFGADGQLWWKWQVVCTWEYVLNHCQDAFATYEDKWKQRYGSTN